MNPVLQQFREQILLAAERGTPLCIQGGGSKSWYGNQVQGEVLDTRAYSGIIAYEPTELVITVRAGTPLKELESLLGKHGQMLASEVPHFGEHATVGGMLAAGFSGPRRAYSGAIRDFVLGVSVMNGRGNLLKFGGQVVKNVAGYDVSRLMVGAMGAFGLLTEISLKVMPKPMLETSLAFAMSEPDALHALNLWAGQALPISGSAYHAGQLSLRLAGSESAIELAKRKLGGQEIRGKHDFWMNLREHQDDFFVLQDERALLRISLPSTAPVLKLSADTLIEWGGAQRWLWTDEPLESVRKLAQSLGGHVTQFRYADTAHAMFTPMSPALLKIHQQLKKTFDPADIFNPGRLFASA